MITITAKSWVKTGKREDFLVLAKKMVKGSRKEKGCISYNLYEDIKNPDVFIVIEEWEDETAIQNHNTSKHFTEIVPEMGKLRQGKPEVHLLKNVTT